MEREEAEREIVKRLQYEELDDQVLIENILENMTEPTKVLNILAGLCFQHQLFELILPFLQVAHEQDPHNKDTLFNLGYVLNYLGEKELALAYLEVIVEKDKEVEELIASAKESRL